MRGPRGLIGLLLLLVMLLPAWAQDPTLKASVAPERDAGGNLTGRYVARVSVDNAPTARQATFRLDFPTAYGVATAPDDIRIVAVRPGEDVVSIDANTPETPGNPDDDTPVVFAEMGYPLDSRCVRE